MASESEGHMNPTKETKQSQAASKRVWSEDEEILILKTAIEFSSKKGVDPTALGHRTLFFNFIKQSFSNDYSKRQLVKKLKSLKKKFQSNFVKGKAIATPHQNKLFELSLSLWGSNKANCTSGKEVSKIICKKLNIWLGKNVVREVIKHKGEGKMLELLRQWKEVEEMELELSLKRAELVMFETQIMLDKYKKSPSML
ncbi:probable transcription factor At1g61730 [Mangifera indica]|uniref:probable transcription factor At1g61730 n=1 Tax=Mangifera indica TaxID=29780 RepID=UPI001CFA0D84|nr:probable transcription factor At1g61730 [Mangifera indica]